MKTKTLINLSLVLIIAILAFFARKSYRQYDESKPNAYLETVSTFSKENISQIFISKNNDLLEFQKGNGAWMVNDKRASAGEINQLLGSLFPDSSPDLVATSQKQLENLKVSSTSATTVTVNSGDQSLVFLIGEKRDTTPVRIQGTDEAYALKALPSMDFDINIWVDLKVTSFNDGDIQKLAFDNFTLAQDENNNWTAQDSDALISNDAVNTFLIKLNPLNALGIADQLIVDDYDLNFPTFTLNLTGQRDNEIQLTFFAGSEADKYLVKRVIVESNEEEIFVITSYQAENLNKDLETFLE